jgi:hypothetical protein
MNAKEMFEILGWKLMDSGEYKNEILYYQKIEGNATYNLDFYFDDMRYGAYGDIGEKRVDCYFNVNEHQAITKQLDELGWL